MAEPISSGRIVQKPEIVVDANFGLPPGVTGMRQQTAAERGAVTPEGSRTSEGGVDDSEFVYDNPELDEEGYLRPPQTLKIVSQVVRQGPGGAQVVDVILEVEDVPGADAYDMRITKV